MHGSMHLSGTYSWKNQGGRRRLVFERGASPPASLPADVRLNDLRILPSRRNPGAISRPFSDFSSLKTAAICRWYWRASS
jgi:hypothetical protein